MWPTKERKEKSLELLLERATALEQRLGQLDFAKAQMEAEQRELRLKLQDTHRKAQELRASQEKLVRKTEAAPPSEPG